MQAFKFYSFSVSRHLYSIHLRLRTGLSRVPLKCFASAADSLQWPHPCLPALLALPLALSAARPPYHSHKTQLCTSACLRAWRLWPLRLLCVLTVQCLCSLRAAQLLWLQVVSATVNTLSRTCAACVARLLQTSSCRASPSSLTACLRRFWEEEYKFLHVSPYLYAGFGRKNKYRFPHVSPCVSAGFGRKKPDFRMCLRVSPVSPQVVGRKNTDFRMCLRVSQCPFRTRAGAPLVWNLTDGDLCMVLEELNEADGIITSVGRRGVLKAKLGYCMCEWQMTGQRISTTLIESWSAALATESVLEACS